MNSPATAPAVSHWDDYGGPDPRWACERDPEFCSACGRQMVTSVEPTGQRSRRTGAPTFATYHSCPTWVFGWRNRNAFTRFWFTPGDGHDSHDAENLLSARGYR